MWNIAQYFQHNMQKYSTQIESLNMPGIQEVQQVLDLPSLLQGPEQEVEN